MNIGNKKMLGSKSGPYEDLRQAIASTCLKRAEDGVIIVRSENSATRDAWLFDFRALILQPEWIDRYASIFWELYGNRLPFQIGGVETAGIPLVTAIVMKGVQRGTPVNGFYMRKSRKRKGLMKYIEGTLTNEPIVFVDDLINSGQSVEKQIAILKDAGKTVTDVFTLLALKNEGAYESFERSGVTIRSLFTLDDFDMPARPSMESLPRDPYEVIWRYRGPSPSFHIVLQKSAPVVDTNCVYFGRDDGVFVALDRMTGDVVWEFAVGKHPFGKGILSSPALHAGSIFFGAYDGSVYALHAQTGKLLWRNDDADWIGSSPDIAADAGLLFIGLEFGLLGKRGGIGALNITTGKTVWRAQHSSLTHGSPLYIRNEGLVVIGSNDGILYAYEAKTGVLRWRCAARADIKTKPVYDSAHRAVIFGAMDGAIYSVFALDGTPLHVRETGAGIYSIPLLHEGSVYVASLDKTLYALDAATWRERWSFETGGRIFASPHVIDSSLYIGSNDGKLYEIDTESGTLRSCFQTTERIVNAIAADGQNLYVPTFANEIYCIQKRV